MPVPSAITDLSTTAASNSPAGSDNVFPDLDNYLRAQASFIALLRDGRGLSTEVSLASAATTDIGGASSMQVQITGTTTITSFGTNYLPRILRFAGALTLTHNATTLILPTGANITTAAGDMCLVVPVGTSGWRVMQYQRALSTTLEPGQHTVLAVPGDVAKLEDALDLVQSWSVPPGSSLTIEVASGFSLSAVSGFSHPDCPRVSVVDMTQSVGSDTVKSALMSDYDGIRNGPVVSEPVNVPLAPAAGATSTVTLSRVRHLFSWAERVSYFASTGEGIDAFSLPTGVYRLAGTEVGNFPLLTTPQKAGLLIVPGAEESRAQWFLSDTGGCWRRVWTRVSGAPVWGSWTAWSQEPINNGDGATTGSFDWNAITEPGIYRRNSAGAGTSNGPTTNFVGLIEVIANHDRSYILQRAYQVPATTTTYIRTYASASWSVWRTYTGV